MISVVVAVGFVLPGAVVVATASAEPGTGDRAALVTRDDSTPPLLQVPPPAPVRVEADGVVGIRVRNNADVPVVVDVDVAMSSLDDAGSGSLTLAPGAWGSVPVTLDDAGQDALRDASWLTASLRLTASGEGVSARAGRTVRLVATSATPVLPTNPTNPLAGVPWATYEGNLEPVWGPYTHADDETQDALAPIALTPKARWFVSKVPPARLRTIVHDYVAEATAADPDALVQLTMFVLDPWETRVRQAVPTPAQVKRNKAYIRAFTQGIGSARAMVVVQPDGPFAGQSPGGDLTLAHLVGTAVHQLANLPRTSAYIDMGSADWHRGDTSKELPLLLEENIEEARGFATDVTHADSTSAEIEHAHLLIRQLAAQGVPGKHAIIDTSDNGRPFGGADWQAAGRGDTAISAAPPCTSATQRLCLVIGIPPTTDVANPRWGLSAKDARVAATIIDGYVWVKRPWCNPHRSGYPFEVQRGLDTLRWSPFG